MCFRNPAVYFTKDSLLNPNKAVQAQLVEESGEGFYIVGLAARWRLFISPTSLRSRLCCKETRFWPLEPRIGSIRAIRALNSDALKKKARFLLVGHHRSGISTSEYVPGFAGLPAATTRSTYRCTTGHRELPKTTIAMTRSARFW